jgi:hypothetical protein
MFIKPIMYTTWGGGTYRWYGGTSGDRDRWQFNVQDTGPGFHAGPGAPIVDALDPGAPGRAGDNAAPGSGA